MSVAAGRLAPGPRAAAESACLVVVDVQNDFCHPAGTMGKAGRDLSRIDGSVGNTGLLVETARAAGVPVVFVITTHGPDVDSAEWLCRYAIGFADVPQPAAANCLAGGWGAELYRLQPLAGEPVVVKHRYNAFTSPEFRTVVAATGRRSLVFAGITTNVCVEATMRAAVDADYLATLVTDACAAYDDAEHEAAVTVLGRHFGALTTTGEVRSRWRPRGTSADPAGHRNTEVTSRAVHH